MIDLIVLDVDGCMTNGEIIYSQDGNETKTFNVKDGLAIVSWMKLGKKAAIITGRESKIVRKRAQELGIDHLYQKVKDKKQKLVEILEKENLSFENVAVIGDDLNDYQMLSVAKRSFSPNDAVLHIKKNVQTILAKKGGEGAIREMIDILIEEENLNEEFLKLWL